MPNQKLTGLELLASIENLDFSGKSGDGSYDFVYQKITAEPVSFMPLEPRDAETEAASFPTEIHDVHATSDNFLADGTSNTMFG